MSYSGVTERGTAPTETGDFAMTYFVTALTNDRARLIVKEMRVSDKMTAEVVAGMWAAEGYIIFRREEG
jgi:hypothetical protein